MANVIIFTNEYFPFKGGIGRYCEEVINEIKLQHKVTLVGPAYDSSLTRDKRSEGIRLELFPGGQFKYWHLPKLIKKVSSIDFEQYDYVLVADWPFWVAIEFLNRFSFKRKIRFNLMLHGSEVLNLKFGRASIFSKILNMFDGVKKIFTNSNYTKKILLEYHQVPKDISIITTYLGVNESEFARNNVFLKNVNNKTFNILSVGRLDERKGFDNVIKALGMLDNDVKQHIIFTIVGNGSLEFKEYLKNLAKENSVDVEIKSGVSDSKLNELYGEANLFVLAAKSSNKKIEGFGLVFLEAAKHGVPSLATDVGAISEVVKNENTGLVVKEDISELSQAIYRCYTHRDLLVKFSNNCVNDVANYSWAKLADITFSDINNK